MPAAAAMREDHQPRRISRHAEQAFEALRPDVDLDRIGDDGHGLFLPINAAADSVHVTAQPTQFRRVGAHLACCARSWPTWETRRSRWWFRLRCGGMGVVSAGSAPPDGAAALGANVATA